MPLDQDNYSSENIVVQRSLLKDITIFLTLLILVIVITKSVFYEPFRIPSGSMLPTLRVGDYIIVNKMSYGLKVPFSDFSYGEINLNPIYLWKRDNVKRGDVIVFKFPKRPERNYIKRVIGLPGDKVKIVDKKVFINGKEVNTVKLLEFKESEDFDNKYRDNKFTFHKVKGQGNYTYQTDSDNFYKVDYEEKTIGSGEYFVLGDNRDFSNDSRYWGTVPFSHIKGKAAYVWLSLGRKVKRRGKRPEFYFRLNRMGKKIN